MNLYIFAAPHPLTLISFPWGILRTFYHMTSLNISLMVDMNELNVDLKTATANKTLCLSSAPAAELIGFQEITNWPEVGSTVSLTGWQV